jgi:hypothetical protein
MLPGSVQAASSVQAKKEYRSKKIKIKFDLRHFFLFSLFFAKEWDGLYHHVGATVTCQLPREDKVKVIWRTEIPMISTLPCSNF